MTMDVHSRFRTEAHNDVVNRFNERFLLSLIACQSCLVVDDELNILPVNKHAKAIVPIQTPRSNDDDEAITVEPILSEAAKELAELKTSLAETDIIGALVENTKTLDQARALLTFAEAISEKTLRSTVALTAGRGRGKSAALGLAIATAIGYGYSNIFVTSPSPENLKTLFEFIFKGLNSLAYKEHTDYEAIASTNPEFNGAIVRINIFRGHRQTIQYIQPTDYMKLGAAELVVVDEAAAIPLPIVKNLLGPYLVFLASTINGYEGTGRSLSLKLIQQLRQQAITGGSASNAGRSTSATAAPAVLRTFREVALSEPIRYSAGDNVESWLNTLLCLDATIPPKISSRLPPPSECKLFALDRDALFSFHTAAEAFLKRVMSLYVSSHYKNTPNDLQLLSDAPAHRLFVLLGPHDTASSDSLPDVLAVVQVCLEGKISRASLQASLQRGIRSAGDLIPWTISQQFQDDGFAGLSGARVVRIATHPDAVKMGYGTRAVQLLSEYYEGKLRNLDDDDDDEEDIQVDRGYATVEDDEESGGLTTEKLRPRKGLPPLLVPLTDIKNPERLHWLGVSYGLTLQLFNFWSKANFQPVYLRQTPNDITAEHTMVMIKALDTRGVPGAPRKGWLNAFTTDFCRRFASLLSYEFRNMDLTLSLAVLDCAGKAFGLSYANATEDDSEEDSSQIDTSKTRSENTQQNDLTPSELHLFFTPHDIKRLDAYSRGQVDYHMILDLLGDAAKLYFTGKFPNLTLPKLQAFLMMAMGLQHKPIESISEALNITDSQSLALFGKAIRRIISKVNEIEERSIEDEIDAKLSSSKETKKQDKQKSKEASKKETNNASIRDEPTLDKTAIMSLLSDQEMSSYSVPADGSIEAALSQRGKKRTMIERESDDDEDASVPANISVKRTKQAELEKAPIAVKSHKNHAKQAKKSSKPKK